MKMLALAMLIAGTVPLQAQTGHVPFPEFYVTVETNDWLGRAERKTALNVKVSMSRHSDHRQGGTSIRIDCFEFDAGIRGFDDQDQAIFHEAATAAKTGQEFSRTIVSPAIRPREIETRFESKPIDGRWQVRVTRGIEQAVFEPVEGERLQAALVEAKAGEAWFQCLLSGEALPEPTVERHPPRSQGYFLISRVGAVDCLGFDYEISVNSASFRPPLEYSTGHTIAFKRDGERAGTIGRRKDALLDHVSAGLDSLERNEGYRVVADNRSYKVEANRASGEVEVTIARSDFFQDRSPLVGRFNRARLDEIRELIAEAAVRETWFKEHEAQFFTRVTD